jgi:hypothetical protein
MGFSYSTGKTKIFNTELYLGGIKATKSKETLILVSDHKIDNKTLLTDVTHPLTSEVEKRQ